jgi:hypothetical protein
MFFWELSFICFFFKFSLCRVILISWIYLSFLDFNFQHWICRKWSFMIFFIFFIKLSYSYDSHNVFSKLAWIDLSFFIFFFIFFLFHHSTLDVLEIRLHNFFDLLSIVLSLSHYPDRGLNNLTWVDSCIFFVFIFNLIYTF